MSGLRRSCGRGAAVGPDRDLERSPPRRVRGGRARPGGRSGGVPAGGRCEPGRTGTWAVGAAPVANRRWSGSVTPGRPGRPGPPVGRRVSSRRAGSRSRTRRGSGSRAGASWRGPYRSGGRAIPHPPLERVVDGTYDRDARFPRDEALPPHGVRGRRPWSGPLRARGRTVSCARVVRRTAPGSGRLPRDCSARGAESSSTGATATRSAASSPPIVKSARFPARASRRPAPSRGPATGCSMSAQVRGV